MLPPEFSQGRWKAAFLTLAVSGAAPVHPGKAMHPQAFAPRVGSETQVCPAGTGGTAHLCSLQSAPRPRLSSSLLAFFPWSWSCSRNAR